jgi:GNAT superfamily N-acetyltransferase
MDNGFEIRLATVQDIPIIIKQRRAMFDDIGGYDSDRLDAMNIQYAQWVKERLTCNEFMGWFVINENRDVVAGAGLWIQELMPNPFEASGYRGHVVNVYTDPEYRHRGLARQLMLTVLDWCKAQGIKSVTLNASEFGRPLYESLGFKQDNHMIIHFD